MAAQGAVYLHNLHTYFPESARIVYDLDRNRVPIQSSPVHTPLCTCRRRVATHHSSRIRWHATGDACDTLAGLLHACTTVGHCSLIHECKTALKVQGAGIQNNAFVRHLQAEAGPTVVRG